MDNINGHKRFLYWFVVGISAILLACLLSSCIHTRYIPIETIRTDSIYNTVHQRDSIYVRDSIYIIDKGDTVYQYRYKYIFIDKIKNDTLYIEKTDSVHVPYPVEKKLTHWQSIKQDVGGYAITSIVIVILIVFGKIIYKLKKGG